MITALSVGAIHKQDP